MIKINLLENSKGKGKQAAVAAVRRCPRWKWATWARPS